MVEILHRSMPADLSTDGALPGVRPLMAGDWLRVDEAYAGQMAYRRRLLREKRDAVLCEGDATAQEAAEETLHEAIKLMPGLGIRETGRGFLCPDGVEVDRHADGPLAVMAQVLQEDICILQSRGDEHILAAAALCFPASWTLSEKVGRPLSAIHDPVDSYDDRIAVRVQRLFDGVQVGKPLWRNNMLWYDDPDLFQPRREVGDTRQEPERAQAPYQRAERQCILRLPQTRAVIFAIHSYVTRRDAS